jgi:thiol-disulfide isomerase/thioredoxin
MKAKAIFLCSILLFSGTGFAAKQGDSAPTCALDALNHSTRYDLQAFRGKVVYVDFWASWCAPCAKSFPFLNTLHQKYQTKGFDVLAVNMDEQPADATAFLANHPATFSIASDLVGQCAENFAVEAMPSSYIIDKKGVIRHVHLGFREEEAEKLHGLIEQLLAEK